MADAWMSEVYWSLNCKHNATNIIGIKYGMVQVMTSLTADRKPWNSITIDVTIGGVFDYIGLKDLKICHFQPYHDHRISTYTGYSD